MKLRFPSRLRSIAFSTGKLDVSTVICTALRNRHDVVDLVCAQLVATVRATSPLGLKNISNVFRRVNPVDVTPLSLSISMVRLSFLRIF